MTHLFASWLVAAHATDNPRDCRLVTLAGVLPDADGFGLVLDVANQLLGRPETSFYHQQHHFLLHGWPAALALAILLACPARRRLRVFLASLLAFHLHLLCDLVGSRGPTDVDLWPVFYSGPLSKDWMWLWKDQWALDAWPNRLIGAGLLVWTLAFAIRRGHSIVGLFSARADGVVVSVLRGWWQSANPLAASCRRALNPVHRNTNDQPLIEP